MDHGAIEIDAMEEDEANEIGNQSVSAQGRSLSPPVRFLRPGSCSSDPLIGSYLVDKFSRGLGERQRHRRTRGRRPSRFIFRIPDTLRGINRKAEEPELVSIGPYHRGKPQLLEFEEHKWFFLERFLSRTDRPLGYHIDGMAYLELQTWDCYTESVNMPSHDFVEMMLLDGCFVLELMRHLMKKDPIDENDPIYSQPWIIPVLVRDLLKLENQLPLFLLESLFKGSKTEHGSEDALWTLALEVFNLTFRLRGPREIALPLEGPRCRHLLQLFHRSIVPSTRITHGSLEKQYRPSDQSIQSASLLKLSGIKFRARKAKSFLDINFRDRVLQIPSITINDDTSTLLINCLALEQGQEFGLGAKYFTDYISFMSCLINNPKDVSLLCSDRIITRFSQDDHHVANVFNKLGKSLVFNVHNCYLSKQFQDVELYYSSNWATMLRIYFCSPWSFISVFSAFLIILLTATQTMIAVISYRGH